MRKTFPTSVLCTSHASLVGVLRLQPVTDLQIEYYFIFCYRSMANVEVEYALHDV